MNVEMVRPAMPAIDSSVHVPDEPSLSFALMALAENPYWVLLKAYSALPGGSKGCGGDDFSSGWSMNNFPVREHKDFCIKTPEKVTEKYDELTLYFYFLMDLDLRMVPSYTEQM
ncbi:hypothetical protein OIU77_024770 [Salix suchowensis]|uniref:Uncharacterized protein n=1 Tax=Salix suchowensis TaxID=1278906 RepID=A0ABQ9BW29_9ROSI|nr:hypothetical protein OIU77_024770 [Salix suchowensis]